MKNRALAVVRGWWTRGARNAAWLPWLALPLLAFNVRILCRGLAERHGRVASGEVAFSVTAPCVDKAREEMVRLVEAHVPAGGRVFFWQPEATRTDPAVEADIAYLRYRLGLANCVGSTRTSREHADGIAFHYLDDARIAECGYLLCPASLPRTIDAALRRQDLSEEFTPLAGNEAYRLLERQR